MNGSRHIEDYIKEYLQNEGIYNKALYDDLFDHLHLEIEYQLQETENVEYAFRKAIHIICPEGALKIQKDLNHLISINYKVMLHRIIFATGSFGGLIILLSFTAFLGELIYFDFARQLIMLGLLIIIVSVYPYTMIKWYRRSKIQLE